MREGETIKEVETRIFASDALRTMESKKVAWDKLLKPLPLANEKVKKAQEELQRVAEASETTIEALLADKDNAAAEQQRPIENYEEAVEKEQTALAMCHSAEDEYLTAVAVKGDAFSEAIASENIYRRRMNIPGPTPRHGFLFATAA
jgi:hypothetical protein